jgi:hypothetical protein
MEKIDLSLLPSGTYLVDLMYEGGRTTKRIVKN